MKVCGTCRETKPVTGFYRIAKGVDYWRSDCKDCQGAKRRKTYRADLLRRYGLTPDQYDEMLARQDGLCATCRQPETARSPSGGVLPLAVDHDHSTGQVRGLLCMRCNLLVGVLESHPDGRDAVAMARAYIEDFRAAFATMP